MEGYGKFRGHSENESDTFQRSRGGILRGKRWHALETQEHEHGPISSD